MDIDKEQALETYRSMISIGTETLRALQLLNGGAVVALLAFLGQAAAGAVIARDTRSALCWFIAGLVVATLAHIITYLTQLALWNELIGAADPKATKHGYWLTVAVVLALVSILSFALGARSAVDAIAG